MNSTNKIPKTVHYCWFGGKEKPDLVKKCMNSWKEQLPDYQIVEWNESNFDINLNPYVKEAYASGKYAFVSDYVRVHALYHYGGIYLDTDVEVFKTFDDLLHHPSFWGFEQANYIATSTIGAQKGNKLIRQFLESYKDKKFLKEDGTINSLTNVAVITRLLENLGLLTNGQYQEIDGLGVFYPQTYFSPYDYINCQKLITNQSYAMHHFYKSWLPLRVRIKGKLKSYLSKIIGGHNIARLRKIYRRQVLRSKVNMVKKIVKTLVAESKKRGILITLLMNISHLFGIGRGIFFKILYFTNIKSTVFSLQSNSKIEIFNKRAKILIGKFVFIRKNASIRIDFNGVLTLGNNVFINDNCTINCVNRISIGKNTKIAPNVCINDHDHNYKKNTSDHLIRGEVTIGENVWIGSNVVILRDTHIGDNVVVAAGSIVKGIVPSNTIYMNKREIEVRTIQNSNNRLVKVQG